MTETRNLICIGCPMGCPLTVTVEDHAVTAVSGNTCKRGDAYARREVTNPSRVVTTTVSVTGGDRPTVAVKTRGEVPKAQVLDCVRALAALKVPAPVAVGDVIAADILGSGADVVATSSVEAL